MRYDCKGEMSYAEHRKVFEVEREWERDESHWDRIYIAEMWNSSGNCVEKE